MLARPRAAAIARSALAAFVPFAVVAGGCNALSGIGNFAVDSEGGAGVELGDGPSGSDGAPADGGVPRNVDATADASDETAAATGEGGGDAATEGAADVADDGAADADETGIDGAPEGGRDATTDGGDGGCPIAHSNGQGQTYYDCTPLGTYNVTQAFEACTAFTGNMSLCTNDPVTCGGGDQVCSSSAMCACWRYNGTNAGRTLKTTTCQCLGSSAPMWD
jgi:hypothetical protein